LVQSSGAIWSKANMFAFWASSPLQQVVWSYNTRNVYNEQNLTKRVLLLWSTGFVLPLDYFIRRNRFKVFILFAGAIVCFFYGVQQSERVFWLYRLDGMGFRFVVRRGYFTQWMERWLWYYYKHSLL
jgi:hypothetical protein